jgi:hypothetical protein
MYDSWCNYQDQDFIEEKYETFIDMACEALHRDKHEVRKFLFSQSWFNRPINSKYD